MKLRVHNSLSNRILIMVLTIVCALSALYLLYFTRYNRATLEAFERDAGLSFAESLAQSATLGIVTAEPSLLTNTFAIALRNDRVRYIAAYDASGHLIRQVSLIPIDFNFSSIDVASAFGTHDVAIGERFRMGNDEIEDIHAAVFAPTSTEDLSEELLNESPTPLTQESGRLAGWLRIGLSRSHIDATQRIGTIISLSIGLAVLVIALILAFIISRRITRPLLELEAGTRRISSGDLSVHLPIASNDEVGAVAKAFNAMAGALRESTVSKDYVDNIVDSMNEAMIVLSPDRTVVSINTAAEELLGYRAPEIAGHPADALFSDRQHHPLTVENWPFIILEPRSGRDTLLRHKDGLEIPANISTAPITDRNGKLHGVVCVARDMREINDLLTKLKRHTTELERYQSVLLSMLDDNDKDRAALESERTKTIAAVNSISDGLIMFDLSERLLLINPAAKHILGFSSDMEVEEKHLREALSPAVISMLQEAAHGIRKHSVRDILLHGESVRTIRVEAFTVGDAGQNIGGMITMRDITRERKLDEAKHELITNVSHELRTPLAIINNVIANALVGVSGPLTPSLERNLITCQTNTKRLGHIIDNLLSIAAIDAGKLAIHRASGSIAALVAEITAGFESDAAAKRLTLEVHTGADPLIDYIDARAIGSVLMNLISNAIRYTPAGGKVIVSACRLEGQIEIAVADTGVGIAPAEQASIFEQFHQVGREFGPGEKGVGLGLAISRLLVQKHGGSIGLTSTVGEGSRFSIVLPDLRGRDLVSAHISDCLGGEPPRTPYLWVILPTSLQLAETDAGRSILNQLMETIRQDLHGKDVVLTRSPDRPEIALVAIMGPDERHETFTNTLREAMNKIQLTDPRFEFVIGSTFCDSANIEPHTYIEAALRLATH